MQNPIITRLALVVEVSTYIALMCMTCAETEEGFMKVCSQRPIMIDQTVHRGVDLDDVILPSVMITRFMELKHFVKVIALLACLLYLPNEWSETGRDHVFTLCVCAQSINRL